MKDKKNIWLIFVMFLVFIPLSFSVDVNYSFNSSNLPFIKTEYILIQIPNETYLPINLTLSYGKFLGGGSIIETSNYLNNLSINVNVPLNTIPQNYLSHTNISFFSNVTNSTLFTNITFEFNIFNIIRIYIPNRSSIIILCTSSFCYYYIRSC